MTTTRILDHDGDGVTLLIHSTWRGRLRLALLLLRTYADRVLVAFLGAPVLAVVAGVAFGPPSIDPGRLAIASGTVLPISLFVLLVLFVLGLKPTFHWMRNVTALRFSPSGIRATLKAGETVYKGWEWIAAARRRPFGLEIEALDPRWARWYVQNKYCNLEALSRLEALLVAHGKLARVSKGQRPKARRV